MLAELLVDQLASIQCETESKKSTSMYADCMLYLRRAKARDCMKDKYERRRSHDAELNRHGSRDISALQDPSIAPTNGLTPSMFEDENFIPSTASTGPLLQVGTRLRARDQDRAHFTDAVQTLRRIFEADAVAMVDLEDYEIYSRDKADSPKCNNKRSRDTIMDDWLLGSPWPDTVEPVVNRDNLTSEASVRVMADDCAGGLEFNFHHASSSRVLSDYLGNYLKTRQIWWSRDEIHGELGKDLMDLLPNGCQTALFAAFLSPDGRFRFATVIAWTKPPSAFSGFDTSAIPFIWVVGGCMMAALALRRVRTMETTRNHCGQVQAQYVSCCPLKNLC